MGPSQAARARACGRGGPHAERSLGPRKRGDLGASYSCTQKMELCTYSMVSLACRSPAALPAASDYGRLQLVFEIALDPNLGRVAPTLNE